MKKKLRVLLVSPLPGFDPAGGDVTYTQTLLADPPEGVEYETYGDALARGALREYNRTSWRRGPRSGLGALRELALFGFNAVLNRLRRVNLLFWEPFRFFSLETDEYDLIHVHIFSARFDNLRCPVVFSNGGELGHLYRHARNFPEGKILRRQKADRGLGWLIGMNVSSEYLPQVARLQTYSEAGKASFVRRRVLPAERIDVISTYLPKGPAVAPSPRPYRVGFIARNFQDKGGPTLLEAWRIVRAERPDAELFICGCEPELPAADLAAQGIEWKPYVERQELLHQLLPSLHAFVYPTNYDYLPYILLEVMSRGIPIAASDHFMMPELVAGGTAGLLSPVRDAPALARNILRLLDPSENARFGAAGRAHFESHYADSVVRPLVRRSYDAALGTAAPSVAPAPDPAHSLLVAG